MVLATTVKVSSNPERLRTTTELDYLAKLVGQ